MSTKKSCELVMFNEPPIGYNGKKKVHALCGREAYYRYNFSNGATGFYCKEHGESMAGNFTHQLIVLPASK